MIFTLAYIPTASATAEPSAAEMNTTNIRPAPRAFTIDGTLK